MYHNKSHNDIIITMKKIIMSILNLIDIVYH